MNKSTVANKIPLVNKKFTSPQKVATFGVCRVCGQGYSEGADKCSECDFDLDITYSEGYFSKVFTYVYSPPKQGNLLLRIDRKKHIPV